MTAAKSFRAGPESLETLKALEARGIKAELVDGNIVYKAQAGWSHSAVHAAVIAVLRSRFHGKPKRTGGGGWWILTDASIQFRNVSESGRILRPDLAGWKRERVPTRPDQDYPVALRPDWACEVTHTTLRKDTTVVPETLAAEGVPHYWRLDVPSENLQVFELVQGKYALIRSLFREDSLVVIPPFENVALDVGLLLGDDEPDDTSP